MNLSKTPNEINFLPVCKNCHNILFDIPIGINEYVDDYDDNGIVAAKHILPDQCPYCGELFEKITLPTKLPFYADKKDYEV